MSIDSYEGVPIFTAKSAGKRTGLGLSTYLSVSEAYGEKITCESEPGTATKFKALLPIKRRG